MDNVSQQWGVVDRWQPVPPCTGQTQLTNIIAHDQGYFLPLPSPRHKRKPVSTYYRRKPSVLALRCCGAGCPQTAGGCLGTWHQHHQCHDGHSCCHHHPLLRDSCCYDLVQNVPLERPWQKKQKYVNKWKTSLLQINNWTPWSTLLTGSVRGSRQPTVRCDGQVAARPIMHWSDATYNTSLPPQKWNSNCETDQSHDWGGGGGGGYCQHYTLALSETASASKMWHNLNPYLNVNSNTKKINEVKQACKHKPTTLLITGSLDTKKPYSSHKECVAHFPFSTWHKAQ